MIGIENTLHLDLHTSSINESRFKQVSDERRKAICKKMPFFFVAFLITFGLRIWIAKNYVDALKSSSDTIEAINDSMYLDRHFFDILITLLGSIFIAELMMVI